MNIKANKIELFKNLAEFDLDNKHLDFHNEFKCNKLSLENNELSIFLQNSNNTQLVILSFKNASITAKENIEFDGNKEGLGYTLDNLYRGRYEELEQLSEFSKDEKAYFYLEFYEGGKLEFWSDELVINEVSQ